MKQEMWRTGLAIAALCLAVGTGSVLAEEQNWKDLNKDAKRAKIDEIAK